MTAYGSCTIRFRPDWDSATFRQRSELQFSSGDFIARLGDLAPPLLSNLNQTWPARQQYIRERRIERAVMAEELEIWHREAGAPELSIANCRKLRDANTFLVITGQQPGLLLGPMYTAIKAVHAVVLAEQLTRQGYGQVIPAFWIASEDHQLNELNSAAWLGRGKKFESYSFEDSLPERTCAWARPASSVQLDELLSKIENSLPDTSLRQKVVTDLRETYGGSLADWFQALLWRWLPHTGLIVIRPDMPWLQRAAATGYPIELADPLASTAAAIDAAGKLEALGVDGQIQKRPDRTAFFLVENGVRLPVYIKDGQFECEGKTFSRTDLFDLLKTKPETFSSTAILRPVLESMHLPILAAVLGPNEMAYHLQLADIYRRHGVPRPVLVPRVGLTFLESRDAAALDRLQLAPREVLNDPRAIVKRLSEKNLNPLIPEVHRNLVDGLGRYYELLFDDAGRVDATIIAPLQKQQKEIEKQLQNSHDLLNRRRAKRDEITLRQIEQLRHQILPQGTLQERILSPVHFLARYTGFIEAVQEAVTRLEPGEHGLAVVEEAHESTE